MELPERPSSALTGGEHAPSVGTSTEPCPPPQRRDDAHWYAAENGFASVSAMERCHRPIVALASAALAGRTGNVLDLGCGNGALLRKILEANAGVKGYGIERDPSRLRRAPRLDPSFATNLVEGDMFESEEVFPSGRRYCLALLMPGRFLEAPSQLACRLRRLVAERCDQILLYAYGEWLQRHGNLGSLAARAGFRLLSPVDSVRASLAVVTREEGGSNRAR